MVPPAAGAIGDLAAEAMDWPNADKVAKRLRKTVPPQMLEPSELEEMNQGQPQEPPPPSPEQQLAAKELELKDKELQLREKELEVKALEITAKAEQAQAMKPENVKEIVADALAELLAGPQPTITR